MIRIQIQQAQKHTDPTGSVSATLLSLIYIEKNYSMLKYLAKVDWAIGKNKKGRKYVHKI